MSDGVLAAVIGGLAVVWIFRLDRRLRREVHERGTAEEKLRGLLEQSAVGIYILKDDRFAYVNPRFAEIFGYGPEELTGGMGPRDLAAETDQEPTRETVRAGLAGQGDDQERSFAAVRKGGDLIDVSMNGRPVEYDGRPAVMGMALDVTEQVRAQRQLKYLAFYDPLTELPNRSLFYDRLGQALARGKRSQERFALLMLDLDGFKAVNDLHGHETGDALLQAAGRRFQRCVRESDTVARMGGDEFVVLLTNLHDVEDASAVARKILAGLGEPFLLGGRECRVGASIGICVSPEDGEDVETLLGRADAAMYESKAKGKNTFHRYWIALAAGEPVKMPYLDLGPERAVGVPVIDQQHARMAILLNRVADAVKSGQERARVAFHLDELVAFTRHHFETEERMMERHAYPKALAHSQEHAKLLSDVLSIRAQAEGDSLMLTLQSLKDWLVRHISHGDRELGVWLVASGAAEPSAGSSPQAT